MKLDERESFKIIKENAFLDDNFIPAIGMYAMWQLKKNAADFIPGESPMFIERAEGAMIYDVDGNEFNIQDYNYMNNL